MNKQIASVHFAGVPTSTMRVCVACVHLWGACVCGVCVCMHVCGCEHVCTRACVCGGGVSEGKAFLQPKRKISG